MKDTYAVKVLFVLWLLVFALFSRGHAEELGESVCLPSHWPSAVSDLQVDPDLLQGELPNGFRYVLKQNQEPKNRVAVFLFIKAGSLHEKEEQRGLAHFLEHMMFKGTENYPAGSLVEYFQSIGMSFGGDVNAHTAFDETVYNLFLPNGSEKELKNGFAVMADYARRAKLEEEQIKSERGVILAERRARDSASYRAQVASMEFAFRGTRLAERMVIGIESTLQQADRQRLKAFYDSWYRPDNMILVVVGDMDKIMAESLIKKQFSQLSAPDAKPDCPRFGTLQHKGLEAFYHYEPELGKTNVSIETLWDQVLKNDSLQLQREDIVRLMGTLIMGYRLQRLQEENNSPFSRAAYNDGDIVNRIGYGSISAQTESGKWLESLILLDKTLRQALQYGFTEQEVKRAGKELQADLDARALTEKSEDSRKIGEKILMHLGSYRVYQSAQQQKDLYSPIVDGLSVDEINKEFRAVWSRDSRLLSVTGDARLGDDARRVIVDNYRQAIAAEVGGPPRSQTDAFPYLPLAVSAERPLERKYFKDIDVERLVFANGLIVNLKKTEYRQNSVQLMACFGAGEQSEPAAGMAMLAEDTINISGSGQLSQSALDAVAAGSSVALKFRIGENAFIWNGSSLVKDFELLIQMLHTVLYDPGFRENQFVNVKNKVAMMYQKISREIDGAMLLHVQPFLAGGNAHFGLPPWEEMASHDYGKVSTWARSFSRPNDLELNLVGDFDRDAIVGTIEKYFGGVKLQSSQIPDAEAIRFPLGETQKVAVETSMDKALLVVAWPTEDFWDIRRTRRLNILANVFEDRVRKIIREKLGAAYSPSVSSFNSRVYRGYGYQIVQVLVKPGSEEMVMREISAIADQLQEHGISGDELLRAKKPLVTTIADHIQTNQYWLASVLALSSRYPQQLEWPTTIMSDYSSIDENDVNQLGRSYLSPSRAARAVVLPKEMSAQGE
jgi:zinc protease